MRNIEFTRGDTYYFRFQRLDSDKNVITDIAEKLWFTVKSDYSSSTPVIQKTIADETIKYDDDYFYHIVINSEDTRDLKYGEYVYDIQVMNGDVVKTIAKGNLTLTKEVTTDYE